MAKPLAAVGIPGAKESLENREEVGKRLNAAKSLLREHGNYTWLTGKGNIVILNNGIEFAATYFIIKPDAAPTGELTANPAVASREDSRYLTSQISGL